GTLSLLELRRGRFRSIVYFFFFSTRSGHTRFSRDWSSDVCSSDVPAGHQRHTQQRWQHKADTADHHVSQGHVVGNTEIFFQQRDHGQTDHKHDQRLHHLREFPAVMHKRKTNFEGTSRPVRLLFTIFSVEHLHKETSRHRVSGASQCCFCGEVWLRRQAQPLKDSVQVFGLVPQYELLDLAG